MTPIVDSLRSVSKTGDLAYIENNLFEDFGAGDTAADDLFNLPSIRESHHRIGASNGYLLVATLAMLITTIGATGIANISRDA
jgi:hypothetical protein